ncbi:efflux RND transporter permease subunit [Pontibacter cellulosilyticus]|uniref:efflux RND transporter permease subunit n=1 Tax=Pontibacter cellulosilyticus TaxID=1720253 RepID=UPI001E40146E|nr:efflux RND transporter permease subunit [Pontibacter cellulosilyticus]
MAIPFDVVGAVIGHILLCYDLSLVSLMGIIALLGMVVNDSLIMIDYANRQRGDLSAYDALHEADIRRFRPIILETARQAYQLIPMAISLGFGIVFAQPLFW